MFDRMFDRFAQALSVSIADFEHVFAYWVVYIRSQHKRSGVYYEHSLLKQPRKDLYNSSSSIKYNMEHKEKRQIKYNMEHKYDKNAKH